MSNDGKLLFLELVVNWAGSFRDHAEDFHPHRFKRVTSPLGEVGGSEKNLRNRGDEEKVGCLETSVPRQVCGMSFLSMNYLKDTNIDASKLGVEKGTFPICSLEDILSHPQL